MIKQIYKNNLSINYKDEGSQNETVIVLIHGFLETSETWSDFSKELAKTYRIISIDLPGHGKSTLYNEPFTMCKYADTVANVVEYENVKRIFIIGHSMGGYVAMAFAENYPEKLNALSLFHSAPFADNDEKKNARLATIERIKNDEKDEICTSHASSVFANDNIKKFKDEIRVGEMIAKSISEEGIIASLFSMKDRNDRSDVLKNLKVPFLYIIGGKDNFIPMEILDKIEMPQTYKIGILENSGHQGFIEQKEKSLKLINDFIKEFI